ncbi:hypothetical protein [Lysinibacillus fusiformis]
MSPTKVKGDLKGRSLMNKNYKQSTKKQVTAEETVGALQDEVDYLCFLLTNHSNAYIALL